MKRAAPTSDGVVGRCRRFSLRLTLDTSATFPRLSFDCHLGDCIYSKYAICNILKQALLLYNVPVCVRQKSRTLGTSITMCRQGLKGLRNNQLGQITTTHVHTFHMTLLPLLVRESPLSLCTSLPVADPGDTISCFITMLWRLAGCTGDTPRS